MESFFREPPVEEGIRNIVLQNRCGNRLTMLFFEDHSEFEFVYKPNAYRRKDHRARNFSNRDNFTTLFRSFTLPDTREAHVKSYDYDPFVTSFCTETASGAKNRITIVNIADENAYAISARSPLQLAFEPRGTFEVQDGLLLDSFSDRGEEIVSYIRFAGFEENRYRVLDNGTQVLQIFENEVILVGGEESRFHAQTALGKLWGKRLEECVSRNEELLAPALAKGRLSCIDERFQEVLDLNRRVVYSGIDEGGACFGALNRIYHLIWNRDGSMTTSLMALSGNPDYLRTFAPFMLKNPSNVRREDGTLVPEFGQILGSRWSKTEDDGIFYAVLALFTHFQTTGDDTLVQGPAFELVLEALDRFLEKAWESERGLIGSDTRGESPLTSNPYFGYDVVSGKIEREDAAEGAGQKGGEKMLSRCYSLYNNVNTYNLLLMIVLLLKHRKSVDGGRSERYLTVSDALQSTIKGSFVDPEGYLYTAFEQYDDGSEEWMCYSSGVDYWEYAWAVSLGPFYPSPELQLKSARMVREKWPQMTAYGFCPWNTLARYLREYGLPSKEYHEMLQEEIDDALSLAPRYPMQGALGEYKRNVDDSAGECRSWRALPFTAGSLFYSMASLLLQSLPMGIALRASSLTDSIEHFQYRFSRLNVAAHGEGDAVASVVVNGEPLAGSLQIPESRLRLGVNEISVQRGESDSLRLYSSSAQLLDCRSDDKRLQFKMSSAAPCQLVLENYSEGMSLSVHDGNASLPYDTAAISDTGKTLVSIRTQGDFSVQIDI